MKKIRLLICAGIILMSSHISQAQYILNLSEEDYVELSLDMIRKGIQQEDTDKVKRVMGENVSVKGNIITADDIITQNLSQVFTNSSMYTDVGQGKITPSFESYFRFFDIRSSEITINGDTAVVNCELVFWKNNLAESPNSEKKIAERFVFWSPFHGQHEKTASNSPFRWELIECSSIFDFLQDCISKEANIANRKEVQK